MTSDATAPATKQDIHLLMDELGKLYQANERWKDEILDANEKWKEELKQHFEVVAENLVHDFQGALKDKLEHHPPTLKLRRAGENRIVRLEEHVGVAS